MTPDQVSSLIPGLTDVQQVGRPSGQKEVFSATSDGRRVVVKVFKKLPGDEARIERELAAVTKLNSAYVPKVHSSGKVAVNNEERYFLIEDFIEGSPLAARLEGPLPLDRVLELAAALLRACVDFEAQKLAHRDLKPDNLMVEPDGKLWVIDFGLVRHLDLSQITPTGAGVGTVGYAPIEQWRIIDAAIDSRADLFAVGVILYEALIGANPWRTRARDPQNNFDVIETMKTQELPRLSIPGDVDGQLSGFIGWLTQRFPGRRPQAAEEAQREFDKIRAAITRGQADADARIG